MEASHILETCMYVDDLDTAETFYTTVLGLKKHLKEPERHLFLKCGNQQMLLLFLPGVTVHSETVPAHGATGAGHLAFGCEVAELEGWRAHLSDHEIEIEKEVTWPTGGRSLYFRDPAGNSLEVATRNTWGF